HVSRSSIGETTALHSFPTRRSSDLGGGCRRPWEVILEQEARNTARIRVTAESAGVRGTRPVRFPHSDRAQLRPALGLLAHGGGRSEEHTSELQSRGHLVCRLLLEKK